MNDSRACNLTLKRTFVNFQVKMPSSSVKVEMIDAALRNDVDEVVRLVRRLMPDDLNTSMLRSIQLTNNAEILRVLLDAGADINFQDMEGRTAVFQAVKYARSDMLHLLIERGCDINIGKYNQSNCLHLAAKRSDEEIIRQLIDAGHELDSVNWGGNTALLIACRFCQKEVVLRLLRAGAHVDIANKLGHYPLHYSAFSGDIILVDLLLGRGANPDVQTHLGITPIMLAAERRHCKVVEVLAARSSNLAHREQLYGGSVMHWAVSSGCKQCVEHLIDCCARSCMLDHSGRTPLLQAVQSHRANIVVLFLDRQTIDLTTGSRDADVLHFAASLGGRDCVEALISHDLTRHLINRVDCFGDTPLDLALRSVSTTKSTTEALEVVDMLMACGAQRSYSPAMVNMTGVQVDQLGTFAQQDRRHGNTQPIVFLREITSNTDLLDMHSPIDVNEAALRMDVIPKIQPVFKTYSPVKMALISMLKSASSQQMVVPFQFDFCTWLDRGPEAFVLKVTSVDMTDFLYQRTHTPWSLRELCRGRIRQYLGYRANDKINLLPLPSVLQSYLNMKELEEINRMDIRIRSSDFSDSMIE